VIRSVGLRVTLLAALLMTVAQRSSTAAFDQSQSSPPNAQPTATLGGIVVDRHSRMPIRSAVVRLNQPDGRGLSRTVTADGEGRFTFADLPGGEYVLSSTRSGFLPTTLGEQRRGGPGSPIAISDGEVRNDIEIPLSRGGVISGRVVDEHGEPVPAVQVTAQHHRLEAGKRVLRPAFSDRTDDRGDYRLFMLAAGDYIVSAEPNPLQMMMGGPLATMPPLAAPRPVSGAIATYYPNSTTPALARPVTVVEGRETARVNITLAAGKLARVRGRAFTGSGEPFARAVVILQTRIGGLLPSIVRGMTREDGSFELLDVLPGEYIVTVRPIAENPDSETGRADLTVAGNNIDDVVISASRGATLRGTITSETGEAVPLQTTQLSVRLVPASSERGGPAIPLALHANFAFEARNILGAYRLTADANGPVGLWALKRVRWRGEDVTDRAFDFRSNDTIDEIEIVFSDRWATLSGVLSDEGGTPIGDAPLVLFSVDEARWVPGGRHVRGMHTDHQGRYGVSWLLAGEYFLAAPREMDPDQWKDPAFLRSLVDGAARVTLGDEDDRVLDLRIRRD
jgi:hypothetical protein